MAYENVKSDFPKYLYLNNSHYCIENLYKSKDNSTQTYLYEFELSNLFKKNNKIYFYSLTSRLFEDDFAGYQLGYSKELLILRYINFNFERLIQTEIISRFNCLTNKNFRDYVGEEQSDFDCFKDELIQVLNNLVLFDTIDIRNIFMASMLDYSSILKSMEYYKKFSVLQNLGNGLFKINTSALKEISNSLKSSESIFKSGESYKGFREIQKIINSAKKNVKIIDNYINSDILDLLYDLQEDILVKLITKSNVSKNFKTSISKYNLDRNNLEIRISDESHDRFILIDDNECYHSGHSFKDVGKKVSVLKKLNDNKKMLQVFNDIWNSSSELV